VSDFGKLELGQIHTMTAFESVTPNGSRLRYKVDKKDKRFTFMLIGVGTVDSPIKPEEILNHMGWTFSEDDDG